MVTGIGAPSIDPSHQCQTESDAARADLITEVAGPRSPIGPRLRSLPTVAVAAGERSWGAYTPRVDDQFASFIDLDCI